MYLAWRLETAATFLRLHLFLQTALSFNLQLFFSAFLGDLCDFAVNHSKESALRNPYSTTTR
jgi:hypothetical protein